MGNEYKASTRFGDLLQPMLDNRDIVEIAKVFEEIYVREITEFEERFPNDMSEFNIELAKSIPIEGDLKSIGIVRWFSDAKGYGFITPSDGSEDLFLHFTHIVSTGFKTLKEGQKVSFDVQAGPTGKKAINVKKITM